MSKQEEQFWAAVDVIKNLSENGTFQLSPTLILRFYSYYKQATEGPCNVPRPRIWNVVKRVKWDAWQKLGDMQKEEAMGKYVDELKAIVEVLSYTSSVAKFMECLGPFYESVSLEETESQQKMNGDNKVEELEDIKNYVCAIKSKPDEVICKKQPRDNDVDKYNLPYENHVNSNGILKNHTNGFNKVDEEEDDENEEFSDTLDNIEGVSCELGAKGPHDDELNSMLYRVLLKTENDDQDFVEQDDQNIICSFSGESFSVNSVNGCKNGSDSTNDGQDSGRYSLCKNYSTSDDLCGGTQCNGGLKQEFTGDANGFQARGGGDHNPTGRRNPVPSGTGESSSRQHHNAGISGINVHHSLHGRGSGSGASGSGGNQGRRPLPRQSSDINEQLALAVIRLQHTVDEVINRLDSLELLLQQQLEGNEDAAKPFRIPFIDLSPFTAALVFTWPFIAYWIVHLIKKQRKKLA